MYIYLTTIFIHTPLYIFLNFFDKHPVFPFQHVIMNEISKDREGLTLTFRAKVDSFFIGFMAVAIVIISSVYLFPLYRDYLKGTLTSSTTAVVLTLLFLSVGFLLWVTLFIKYEFRDVYLFVKGGPVKSRIRYEDVTKVSPSTDILTGYRILSAKKSIEIFYKTSVFGSVKITPRDEQAFLNELKKRCPHAKFHSAYQ